MGLVRVLQEEVVVDEGPRVGEEGLGAVGVESSCTNSSSLLQLGPRALELGGRGGGCPVPGGVVPEEALERGVHQGSLHRGGRGRLGPVLDLGEAEGQRAVGEGGHLRGREGARGIERHGRQDTAGRRRHGSSSRSGRKSAMSPPVHSAPPWLTSAAPPGGPGCGPATRCRSTARACGARRGSSWRT